VTAGTDRKRYLRDLVNGNICRFPASGIRDKAPTRNYFVYNPAVCTLYRTYKGSRMQKCVILVVNDAGAGSFVHCDRSDLPQLLLLSSCSSP
jgi:hypothetical protein